MVAEEAAACRAALLRVCLIERRGTVHDRVHPDQPAVFAVGVAFEPGTDDCAGVDGVGGDRDLCIAEEEYRYYFDMMENILDKKALKKFC